MKTRDIALRAAAVAAFMLTLAAACSSSHDASSRSASTTTDPSETPNSIPFDVGARVGLPDGWLIQVARVHRPYSNPKLPDLSADHEYIAVDLAVENENPTARTVNAADVFSLGDSTGKVDAVVRVPGRSNGLDGKYPPQTNRTGRLVFAVPTKAQLRMAVNGPVIGTQHAIFMIDPPHYGPAD